MKDYKKIPTLLVIGGKGKMGARFAREFEPRVSSITIVDKDDDLSPDLISAHDVVLIAVPMHLAAVIAKTVSTFVRKDALLVDINSLKSEICGVFSGRCGGQALGTHPMFGPSVHSFKGQKVVLCPVRTGILTDWFTDQLNDLGCELISTTPEEHDRAMAVVQVLNHFGMMVMGEALRKIGIPIQESLKFTSPIYLLELTTVGRLFAQSPELYAEIARSNPFASETREVFLKAASELEELLERPDREAFCNRFLEIRNYFDSFSNRAMELSEKVIDTIVAEPKKI